MNRKIAWLALPLVLAALMLGVEWRADHPTPTKLDIKIRTLFKRPYVANVYYIPSPPLYGNPQEYFSALSKVESEPFANCLFLSSTKTQPSPILMGKRGLIRFNWLFTSIGVDGIKKMSFFINPNDGDNKCVIDYRK